MFAELEIFKLFLLVFVRFAGLIASAPVFGSTGFPITARIGLAAMSAVVVTPVIPPLPAPLPDDAMAFAAVGASEFIIGLIIGFVMTLVFAAVQIGGQIMDLQTGFGMVNVFNPAFETQFPIFGFFLFLLAALFLLAINGHHLMIRALVDSFAHIPPGGFALKPKLMLDVANWGRGMFVDGLMIAAPVAAAMVLAYASLGLLGRVVPQIHLFVVGFPLTITLGLLLTAAIIGVYLETLDGMFHRMFGDVHALIRAMG